MGHSARFYQGRLIIAIRTPSLLEPRTLSTNTTQAMVLFPKVLAKIQAEIDAVVGPDRLPTWADRPNLPYMRAAIE